jgi:Lrp/AsnC family transcriptional regulator, leucine-responsive regulatory protein
LEGTAILFGVGGDLHGHSKAFDDILLLIEGSGGILAMLDELDRRIIEILAEDARISLKELAAKVNLSSPSASERLKRLEERGVIRAFTVDLDPAALGYTLQAIVRIRPLPGQLHRVQQLIEEIPEFTECDKVTGDDCFIARLHLTSIDQLDAILDRIIDRAETNSSIVKSQPVKRRLPPL